MKRIFGVLITCLLLISWVAPFVSMAQVVGPASVSFDKLSVSPVQVVFKVTITMSNPGARTLPVKFRFSDASFEAHGKTCIPTNANTFNDLTVEQLWTTQRVEDVPVAWQTIGTFDNGIPQTVVSKTESRTWPENFTTDVARVNLKGKAQATVLLSVCGGNVDSYGCGTGVAEYRITVNTGLHKSAAGYTTTGLLIATIAGQDYFDNQHSSWWSDEWAYRTQITVDNSTVASDQNNKVVRVHLTDGGNADFSHINADGSDLRFVSADDTTNYPYELEQFGGSADLWVKVLDTIPASGSLDFYMYYGNTDATSDSDPNTVWSGYQAVWHSGDGVDNAHLTDFTSYGNTGNKAGAGNPAQIAAYIAYGQDYNGTSSIVTATDNSSLRVMSGGFTASAVFEADTYPYDEGHSFEIMGKNTLGGVGYAYGWECEINRWDNKVFAQFADNAKTNVVIESNNAITTGTWYRVSIVYDSTAGKGYMYVNGVKQSAEANLAGGISEDTTDPVYIGSYYLGGSKGNYFDGKIDEVRVDTNTKSADWLKAENLSLSDTYLSYASEEQFPYPPTDFAVVQDGNNLVLTWTKGVGANTTVVVRGNTQYPTSVDDGVEVYSGAAATCSELASGNELSTYYYSTWSHNDWGYSTVVHAVIGDEGMIATQLETANNLFNSSSGLFLAFAVIALFSILVFWKPNAPMFMITGGVCLIFALAVYDGYRTNMGLTIALAMFVYSLAMIGFGLRYIFQSRRVSE